MPLGPSEERVETERYVVYLTPGDSPHSAVVQRFRLGPDEVEATLAEVRALLTERGRSTSTWEVCSTADPLDLADRLLALGLVPHDEPLAVGMVLTEEPPSAPSEVEAAAVRTFDEFCEASEIVWAAFGMPPDELAAARERLERAWQEHDRRRSELFLARLGGRPVAAATAVYADAAAVLFGGATAPDARGRGAYRALVRARWDEAVRRGTPALVTHAGALSRPILLRLGFRELTEIRILRDDMSSDEPVTVSQNDNKRLERDT